jgi:MSHA biogenesis protein MshG
MSLFRYTGRSRGDPVTGQLEAASSEAVASHLVSVGVTPIEIAAVPDPVEIFAPLRARFRARKVSLDDLIVFSRQMHTMTRAGIPILRAMRGIAESTHSAPLAEALREVTGALESGHGLAASLQRHPHAFSNLFVSTIHMGEDTGRLEEAFLQLAAYLETDRETRKRVKAATRYPLLVIGAIGIALVILNAFALPVFSEIFKEFDAELPWSTQLLIRMSEFSQNYWLLALAGGVAGITLAGWWVRTPRGHYVWHRYKLRLPVVGRIIEQATLARFARTFALALRSGVPLTRALGVAAQVTDNDYMEDKVVQLRSSVERGETLTRTAAASGLFTPLVLQMMGVGEETGSLDELMHAVAEFYEAEVDYELKRIGESIEPILMVGIGVLVLVLALGVYLPMWDLAGAARGG